MWGTQGATSCTLHCPLPAPLSRALDFRNTLQAASVAAVAELERLVSTPVHRMLGWLAGHRLPNVDCTTNYIGALPADKVRAVAG